MLQRRRGLGIGCGGGEVAEGETAGGRTLGCQYRNHKREDADVWKIRPMRGRTRISRCTTTERSSRERKKKTKKKKKKARERRRNPPKKKRGSLVGLAKNSIRHSTILYGRTTGSMFWGGGGLDFSVHWIVALNFIRNTLSSLIMP